MGNKRLAKPKHVWSPIASPRCLWIVLFSRHVVLDASAVAIVNVELRLVVSGRPWSPTTADGLIHRAAGFANYAKSNGMPFGRIAVKQPGGSHSAGNQR